MRTNKASVTGLLRGHDRVWAPDEVRKNARKMRMVLAQQGYRRPVQVIEGNDELAPGVCPWRDSLKAGGNAAAVGKAAFS